MSLGNIRSWNELSKYIIWLESRVEVLEACCESGGTYSIVSFTNNVGTIEKGVTVTNVTLNWTLPSDPDEQEIDQGVGIITPVTERSEVLTGLSITSNFTWTLYVTKGSVNPSKQTSITFLNRGYWGTSATDDLHSDPTTITHAELIGSPHIFSTELMSSRVQTRSLNAGGGKYLYFAYPASFGTASFRVNGFPVTAWLTGTRAVTNSQGYTDTFRFYRSEYLQHGSDIVVEVL